MSPYKRIDTVKQLQRIATEVRKNPEITVRELKEILGYAQEKSIYSWLRKSPYSGIKEFRKAILTGQYNPGGYPFPPEYLSQGRETQSLVPLATGFTSQGQLNTDGQLMPVLITHSASTFAYLLETNEYFPYFSSGDLIIVDPEGEPKEGSVVFVLIGDKPQIYLFYPGEPPILVHLADRRCVKKIPSLKKKIQLQGQVIQLVRNLS